MHHDAIHHFAPDGSTRGLLVMNHEYADDGLMHSGGMKTWMVENVRKAQAAHGVSVIEVEVKDGRWQVVRPSPWARAHPAAQDRSLWHELGDAIRGTNADYTKIPLRRAVLLLAVPMVLELVLESTFAVVDIWFAARLGPSAVATIRLTETFLFLLYAIGIGLAMAVTAVVARRIGEGDRNAAAISAAQAIWIAVLASLPFAAIGVVWARALLQLMGAD